MSPLTGSCPQCGAQLTFEIGHSRAAVCEYCHSLVARRGQDFEAVGKVAELIPTGTRLARGAEGKLGGHGFRLVGRLQYEWGQGAWDEWYAAFDDGRWGWLAEAQGKYVFTFPTTMPEMGGYEELHPGVRIEAGKHGPLVATDRKRAKIVGVEGEVPDEIAIGDRAATVDFEGEHGRFATADFSDERPRFFFGHAVTLEQLGIVVEPSAPKGRARSGEALKCPNCSAPVELRVPDQTVRAVCASCGALLDTSKGVFRLLDVQEKRRLVPPIPLGKKGTLRGHEVVVVGWMERQCTVEGIDYGWDELLLYEPKTTGYLWLVRSDGHWQLAVPISAADVQDTGASASYGKQRFRFFSGVTGRVLRVLGEFYWTVAVNDSAELADYIAPPHGLSSEKTGDEVNWSYLTHLEADELIAAFGEPEQRWASPVGVGAVQPYPRESLTREAGLWALYGTIAVIALWIFFVARGRTLLVAHDFAPGELSSVDPLAPSSPGTPRTHSFLSETIQLPADRAIEVELTSPVDNAWAYAEGAVIPANGGTADTFGVEASYYHGYSGGESWSEGSRHGAMAMPSLPAGPYVVRAELSWDPKLPVPPAMQLRVFSGGFSWGQLALALLALFAPILALALDRAAFEKTRWQNSTIGGGE